MLKKALLASAILAVSSSIALASAVPYVGGSIGLINNSAEGGYGPSYRGFDGNVSVGYGGLVAPSFYLAGELYGVPGSAKLGDSVALKTSWSVGASLIPGMMLNERTMAYARLGAVDTRFSQLNSNVVGGQAGIGMQTNVCQNWDVRGEYVYTKYRSVSYVSSPNSDAYNIGLVYRF